MSNSVAPACISDKYRLSDATAPPDKRVRSDLASTASRKLRAMRPSFAQTLGDFYFPGAFSYFRYTGRLLLVGRWRLVYPEFQSRTS